MKIFSGYNPKKANAGAINTPKEPGHGDAGGGWFCDMITPTKPDSGLTKKLVP